MQKISRQALDERYHESMKDVRSQLKSQERHWSQLLHLSFIHAAGKVLMLTLLRPQALIFGAVTSIATTLIIIIAAHYYGYCPTNLEPLIGFSIGWLLGMIYEAVRHLLSRLRWR